MIYASTTAGSYLFAANASANWVTSLTIGTGGVLTYSTLDASGVVLPTTTHPVIAGTVLTSAILPGGSIYDSSMTGGPINLSSYSLDEVVTLTGVAGGDSYSIDASLETVPDGGMTLVLLGSALSGLALLKKKLV